MMKRLCTMLLAFFLIVCASPVVFAEEVVEEIPTTSSQIETVVEEETTIEEIKEEESVNAAAPQEQPQVEEKASEETKTEAAPKQPAAIQSVQKQAQVAVAEPENNTFKVIYNVYYRSDGHGQVNGWVKGASKTISVVNGKSNSSSTAINVAYRQMTGNRVADRDINYKKMKYRFNGSWADENGKSVDPNGIEYTTSYKCNGSGYTQDTTVNIYAQYDSSPLYDLTVNYEDKLGHTSGSWNTVEASASGYTHTFKEAQDVPENYQFCYWQNKDNESEIHQANSQLFVDIESLDSDTTYTYLAMYQPAVIVNYYVNDEIVKSVQSFEKVKVYDYAIEDELFDGWYEQDEKLSLEQTYNAPTITAEGEYAVFNVQAKFIEPEPTPVPTPVVPGIVDPTPEPTKPTPTPESTKSTPTPEPILGRGDDEETPIIAAYLTPAVAAAAQPDTDVEEIEDLRIPLAKTEATWALVNFACMIVTVVVSLILVILGWYNRWRRRNIPLDEKYTESYQFWLRNKIIFRIINIILAIVSIIAFILTENIFLTLVFVDRFTPLMVVLAILAIGTAFFSKYIIKEYYPYNDDDPDDDEEDDEE